MLARNVADDRYTKKIFARNVAEVGRNSTAATSVARDVSRNKFRDG